MNNKKALFVAAICATTLGFAANANATTNISDAAALSACLSDTNQDRCELSADFAIDSALTINRDVTIVGNKHTISRSADYKGALFDITGGDVSIQNLTIDGNAPGWHTDLSPDNLDFFFNACNAVGSNGKIDCRVYGGYLFYTGDNDTSANSPAIKNAGNLNLSSSTIQNTLNTGTGGAINNSGNLSVSDSNFVHNAAKGGGAIYSSSNTATITIDGSHFTDNNAGFSKDFGDKNGGAIYITSGELTITDSEFTNNSAENDGGALRVGNAKLSITGSNFLNNKTANDGSAIRLGINPNENVTYQTFTLDNNTFDGNVSLGYYWEEGAVKPGTDIPAIANSEGAISYYGTGYKDFYITKTTFKNNLASFGSALEVYYCDANEIAQYGNENCAGPNLHIDGLIAENNKGSSALVITTNNDVEIANSRFTQNERAFGVVANHAKITNTTINNDKSSKSVNSAVVRATTIEIDNVTHTNNDKRFAINGGQDVVIKNSDFSNNSNTGLYITSHELYPNSTVTIRDTKLTNNQHSGYAGGLRIAPAQDTDLTVNLEGNTTITGNTVKKSDSEDDDGRGGGIAASSNTNTSVTLRVANSVTIKGNHAEIAGDDIAIISKPDDKGITAYLPAQFTSDKANDRANKDAELLANTIFTKNGASFYAVNLSSEDEESNTEPASDKQDEPSEAQEESEVSNPDTADNFTALIAASAALATITALAICKFSKRR